MSRVEKLLTGIFFMLACGVAVLGLHFMATFYYGVDGTQGVLWTLCAAIPVFFILGLCYAISGIRQKKQSKDPR